jgi:lysophosphatidylcholine acyltransferase / lyso-PAF acetyltransferase
MINNNNSKCKIIREESFIEPEIKNPFSKHIKLKLIDKLKIVLNSILLVPLRALLFSLLFIIFLIISLLITINLNDNDLKVKPVHGWRRLLRKLLKYIGKAIKFSVGFHYIKINGKPANRNESTICVAAPHSSLFDIFVAILLNEIPCGVSKYENSKIPIIGRMLRAIQPILVTRENTNNKMNVINDIKLRSEPNTNWPQILIFPEGTCTNRSCLIKFKQGAFIPALPVQPILIEYKNKFDCVTWTWDCLSIQKIIYYTLCQFHTYMEVTVNNNNIF